jgi:hypothetical protein
MLNVTLNGKVTPSPGGGSAKIISRKKYEKRQEKNRKEKR